MWWGALVFTLGLMALFQQLTRTGPLEARATLALGFLLIAAHLGGELAKRLRLPRITGLLLTGFVAGPAWLGLVRGDEVQALGFIADAAMSLIAFMAGSQLTLDTLRQGRAMLTRLLLGTTLVPFALVALVTLSVSPWFPLTVHQPFGDALAVALVLGTIATAASPALTLAVMDDLGARGGALARTVVNVAALKDVLVMVLFALVLVIARPLASAGTLELGVAATTVLRLVGSLAAGAVLGYAVVRYVRLIVRDTVLVPVALAFFIAQVGRLAGLDTMLLALAAGFSVANLTPVESQRLQGAIARGGAAGAVYVVFFALAGAAVQTDSLGDVWPWVLLLVALRALGLRLGARWSGGGRSPSVNGDVAHKAWLGLVSQAGVAFSLAALARRAFPEWGVSLEALVVAMIGVHEIIGPLCFQRALRLTGEVTEGEHVTQKADAAGPALVPGSGSL